MEKQKFLFCAWVSGSVENLNRAVLKEEFSRFGNVSKLYLAVDSSYAKVYLDNLENLKLACNQLHGSNGWQIKFYKDDYKQRNLDNQSPVKSIVSTSRTSTDYTFETTSSNGNIGDMEEECIFAGDYVDVHGRPVEVLMAENGALYVNLDDVKTAGFNIYKKESFANATISKEVNMRHLENFLLDQAKKYVLDVKKGFNEAEMLGIFDRVTAKLQNKNSVGEFGEGRLINASPNSKNFTITTNNISPSASRPSRELSNNIKPSFNHFNQKSKPNSSPFGDRQDGHASRSYDRQNSEASRSGDSQNRRNDVKGPRHSFNSFKNKTQRNDENRRKSNEPNTSFGDSNPTQKRKPRQGDDFSRNRQVHTHSSAHEEPEENWEGDKSSPLKPQSDASSVASERRSLDIERSVLVPNTVYKVKVSYFKPEKKSVFYGQWMDHVNQIEEILLDVNTYWSQFPEIKEPVRNMFCLAFFEECWYRAVVLNGKQTGGAFVELMDYGNKEVIATPLREMSEKLTKIPALSIRLAVHNATENLTLNIDQELEVYVKKHYDDLTHLVEIRRFGPKLNEDPPSPPSGVSSDSEGQEKSKPATKGAVGTATGNTTGMAISEYFMKIPTSILTLTSGENVMIVGYTDDKLILRNKETAKICKDIYSHLSEMDKKPVANPKVGQLVLCSRDGLEGLHRAVIKDIKGQVAELEYVDYYGGEKLTLKSLRNVDALLTIYTSAKIESPAVDWLKNITEKSEILLHNLVMNKTKLRVILDGPKFDLLFTENDITRPLSEKIEQLENSTKEEPKKPASVAGSSEQEPIAAQPSQKELATASGGKSDSNSEKFIKIMYDDMPYVKADLGSGFYVCYSYNETNLTILPSQEVEKYLPLIDDTEPGDTVPYEAAEGEMCLAKFVESWCRAAVTDVDEKNYWVLFVDFGNAEVVPKSDIRRFPRRFAEIPVLGIQTYLIGIPNESKIDVRLKELITDETVLEIDVKVDINEELKYGIEIPSIYAQLQKEKLI